MLSLCVFLVIYPNSRYVFHEVRVPLNSALLAAQSMETSGTISKTLEVEFEALMGSLTTMSQGRFSGFLWFSIFDSLSINSVE